MSAFNDIAEIRAFRYNPTVIGDPIQQIDAAFGWPGFPRGMFYQAPFGLRFELGGGLDSGPIRFVQALDRAKAVASALFAKSETPVAVVSINGEKRTTRRISAAIRQLERIGFPHPFGPATKVPQEDQEYIAEFGEDLFRHWYSAQFTNEEAWVTALLWVSIAREMDIRPKARWLDTIHIVDFQHRLALTAYDDRGLDVVGPSKTALSSLYQRFNPWLLDHDRAEMDARFSV